MVAKADVASFPGSRVRRKESLVHTVSTCASLPNLYSTRNWNILFTQVLFTQRKAILVDHIALKPTLVVNIHSHRHNWEI